MDDPRVRAGRLIRWMDMADWERCKHDIRSDILEQFATGPRSGVWRAREDLEAFERIVTWIEMQVGKGALEDAIQAENERKRKLRS